MAAHNNNKVALLDAGSQFQKVIDRRIRELCVECDIFPLDVPVADLREYQAVVISGGPQSVTAEGAPAFDPALFDLPCPILGICYGMQLLNHAGGGTVDTKSVREDGVFHIDVDEACPLFKGLGTSVEVLLTHGDSVERPAEGFKVVARSPEGLVAAIANAERRHYGVQFHPEVDLTPRGTEMFRNFLDTCGFVRDFTIPSRMKKAIAEIRAEVGDKSVVVLVSGGVDSSVCVALVRKALPAEKIFAVHVDHGFMRKDESAQVKAALAGVGVELDVINAAELFAQSTTEIDGVETPVLCKAVAPEQKRKIIGDTFMKVADMAIKKNDLRVEDVMLVQGTLRPDLIESASKHATSANAAASCIKTHHNDTNLVRQLRDQGRIVEPLKDYHKDEARVLGKELGLPDALVWRQPFPGPGLAIRILCCAGPVLPPQAELDATLATLATHATPDIYSTLLPCLSVGVQGDSRSYKSLVALSGSRSDWSTLAKIAVEVPKRCHSVNRVVYAFGEPIAESHFTEATPTVLSPDNVAMLQAADAIVNEHLFKHGLLRKLSQVPVVLFPVNFGAGTAEGAPTHSIALRTFITRDFMTGVPAIPGRDLPEEVVLSIVEQILREVPGVARVCYDLTSKPPATTEWE